MNSSKKFSFDLNLMFNEKIIQYAIIITLWVQTLGNQGNAPYSSIAFRRYQECNSKHVGLEDFSVTKPIKLPYLII